MGSLCRSRGSRRARPSSLTPVLSFASSVRSKSLFFAAASWYSRTASRLGILSAHFFNAGMLGRDDHISRAKQRVRAGGVDEQLVARRGGNYLRAVAAADPVLLLRHHAVDEVRSSRSSMSRSA